MYIVYFLFSLFSPLLLLISLISPKIINRKINQEFTRKQYAYTFIGFTILFFSMTIIAAPKSTAQPNQKSAVDESRNTDKEIISSQKDDGLILGVQEQEKKNEDESIIPSPTPTPTSTPTPQPTPISTPTPIPTPKPTIIPTVIPTIVPTSTPYIPPPTLAPAISTSPYSCDCSKTCSQMSSCDEAYYQLNTCGCTRRDGDNDGVPCESICN